MALPDARGMIDYAKCQVTCAFSADVPIIYSGRGWKRAERGREREERERERRERRGWVGCFHAINSHSRKHYLHQMRPCSWIKYCLVLAGRMEVKREREGVCLTDIVPPDR